MMGDRFNSLCDQLLRGEMTRRELLQRALAVGVTTSTVEVTHSTKPAQDARLTGTNVESSPLPRGPAIYFDVTAAQHQLLFNRFVSYGLKLQALSMRPAGGSNSPYALYSAAWIPNKPHVDWVACHERTHDDFLMWVKYWQGHGYSVKVLASTNTQFAAIMERPYLLSQHRGDLGPGINFTFDLADGSEQDQRTLQYHLAEHQTPPQGAQKYVPRAIAVYAAAPRAQGSAAGRYRYAVAWEPTTENWFYRFGDDETGFYAAFGAYVNDLQYRCSLVSYLPNGRLFSIFRDDSVGLYALSAPYFDPSKSYWTASPHVWLPDEEVREFRDLAQRGLFPACLAERADGNFITVSMSTQRPQPRQWTATGKDLAHLSQHVDAIMQQAMQGNGTPYGGQARAASIAITYKARLVFAKAYTWAEPTYPITTPLSMFRMASCSKPITSIAIGQLLQNRLLRPTDTFVSKVRLTPPAGLALPAGFENITIDELRSHRSGLRARPGNDFDVARAYGVPTPISIDQLAGYTATGDPTQPFEAGAPSTTSRSWYANINYLLLGLVIRNVSRTTYGNYVTERIFQPLGLTRPALGRSLHSQRASLEVQHHASGSVGFGANAVATVPAFVGNGYGTWRLENDEGFGDWLFCPLDYVAILASLGISDRATSAILKQQSIKIMFTKLSPSGFDSSGGIANGTVGGLFWCKSKAGVDVFAHNGSWSVGGANTHTWGMSRSDGISIAVCMNIDDTGPLDAAVWGQNGMTLVGELQSLLDTYSGWPTQGDLFPSFGIPGIA